MEALKASKHCRTTRRLSKGRIPSEKYAPSLATGGVNLKTTVSSFGYVDVTKASKSWVETGMR